MGSLELCVEEKESECFEFWNAPNANRQKENNGNESDRSKLGSLVTANAAASF